MRQRVPVSYLLGQACSVCICVELIEYVTTGYNVGSHKTSSHEAVWP